MILAPNHPRLLNGSNLILLIVVSLFLVSCSTSKTVYSPGQVSTPKEAPVKQEVPVVDTVEWEVVEEEVKPPIQNTKEEILPVEKKNVYNVALMLPFENNRPDASSRATSESANNTNRFISFYAGTILALTQLEQEGLNLNVDVFDSQRSADKVKSDLKSFRMQNMDALIGPYATRSNKDGLIAAAEFGKENEITVISPWYASSSLAKENPYYVQLRPNTADHFQKIMAHAKANFDDSEIVLMGRDQDDPKKKRSDENIIKYLQKVHRETSEDESAADLRVFRVQTDSLLNGETAYDSIFYETGRKAIIFPFYSSSDGSFMYNCLRRINGEKAFEPIHVYTMPLALDSDQIGFNLFRNLNMKVCRSKYVDKSNNQVRAFEKEYYNRYGTIPNDDAYHGFDVMYFVGKNLMEYGRNFQFFADESQEYLQSSFRLEKVPIEAIDPELESMGLENVNYYVNKHLDIIEFKGDGFVKSDE